jgi:Tfp pilus assembly protein PilF
MNKPKVRWILLLSLILMGLAIYANSLHAPFILDDNTNIIKNPITKQLDNFTHPSQAVHLTSYAKYSMLVQRYVSMLSLALNYRVNGLDTTGYHFINVAIHILTSLLVYTLVLLTFRTPYMKSSRVAPYAPRAALLAGALFVAHPVQTQAVTYIVQRMASLATLFYLASLVSYIRSRLAEGKREKIVFYILALVCAVLGMKSKEIVFTLPLAVALYEWAFFESPLRKRFALWLPLGLTMLIIPVTQLALGYGTIGSSMRVGAVDMPRWHYLLTESRVLITYLRLLIAPVGQNLMYDYPIYMSILNPNVLLSGLFHMGMFGLSIYLYRRSRKGEPVLRLLAYGIWWFYLTLTVESTLVPLHPIYEHRLYLPSVGVFTAAATGGMLLYEGLRSMKWRMTAAAVMVMVPLVLGGMAVARNSVWKTELSLWQDNGKKAPASLYTQINLANAYQKSGRHREAIAHYQIALTLPPPDERKEPLQSLHAEVYLHLGNSYRLLKMINKALEAYRTSVLTEPEGLNTAAALNNMGTIYLSTGENAEAVNSFLQSIKLTPKGSNSYFNLGHTYYNLGISYLALGMKQNAIKALRIALELDPGSPKIRNMLDRILINKQ